MTSDVIVMLQRRHHVISHLAVLRNFLSKTCYLTLAVTCRLFIVCIETRAHGCNVTSLLSLIDSIMYNVILHLGVFKEAYFFKTTPLDTVGKSHRALTVTRHQEDNMKAKQPALAP